MDVANRDDALGKSGNGLWWAVGVQVEWRAVRTAGPFLPLSMEGFSQVFAAMVWQIKPFSHRCIVTANPFETGDAYVSYLVVDANNELQRFDVSADHDGEFQPEGELLCRWRQVYRKEPEKDESGRRQRETAEGLFVSLFDEQGEEGEESSGDREEREILKKFLALLLERKKVLRPRGESPDGRFRLLEHARTKAIYPVAMGEIAPDEFMRISNRLNELVGR
jgi:hypothetical protein